MRTASEAISRKAKSVNYLPLGMTFAEAKVKVTSLAAIFDFSSNCVLTRSGVPRWLFISSH